MTHEDDDGDRVYPTLLHSPWVWWACHGPEYDLEGCAVHGGVCAN